MKSYWPVILGALLVIAIPVVVFGMFYQFGRPIPFYFSAQQETANGSTVVSPYWAGVAMLVGTIFGAIYERLRNIQGEISILSVLSTTFRDVGVFRALIASPLLFSSIYVATQTATNSVMTLAFAFQSGFFCESLLRKRAEEQTIAMKPE